VVGVYTDWTPLSGRDNPLYPEDLDREDPWQFSNVILRETPSISFAEAQTQRRRSGA
jgi:hypothetical protein